MVMFGNQLRNVTDCYAAKKPDCGAEQGQLTSLSYQLAGRLRQSIEMGWGYALPPTGAKQ
jgi:hypothetical protein